MEQQPMVSEISQLVKKLKNWKYREAYIRASIAINLPSQIRALRLKQKMTQRKLADKSKMMQPRISAMETPGATKFNVETLVRVAAALRVGLIIKFVPVSEMLAWENGFSQDEFNAVTFQHDKGLLLVAASAHSVPSVSTPTWVSVTSPRTGRALPERSDNTTMPPSETDYIGYSQRSGEFVGEEGDENPGAMLAAGTAATEQGFQLAPGHQSGG